MLAIGLERVGIKEPFAVERDAGKKAVVKRAFHHIHVLAVAMQQEQAEVPIIVGDCGAGFTISAEVGELVVPAKGFAGPQSADASGEIKLLGGDVFPNRINGMDVTL